MRTHERALTIPAPTTAAHEHGWCTESSHRTLDGLVRYVRCAGCGARRIDLCAGTEMVPIGASRVMGSSAERTLPVGEQRS